MQSLLCNDYALCVIPVLLVGQPMAPIECLYEDKQKKWWFNADSNFPIMRVINERCVICYDCTLTGTKCISVP